MTTTTEDLVQFTGCDLHYREQQAHVRQESLDHRIRDATSLSPSTANGCRSSTCTPTANCRTSGHSSRGERNSAAKTPTKGSLKKTENIEVRLKQMDQMGTDLEVLSIGSEQHFPLGRARTRPRDRHPAERNAHRGMFGTSGPFRTVGRRLPSTPPSGGETTRDFRE